MRIPPFLIYIIISMMIIPQITPVYSSEFNVLENIFFEARSLGAIYPLRIQTLNNSILLREGENHNITFYSYGYRPVNITYTPVPNGELNLNLEPAPLFIFDVLGPGYPDLPMAIYKVLDGYEFSGVTSTSGKAYFYAPFETGEEISFNVMPPQNTSFWTTLFNLSGIEPHLRDIRDVFIGYEYAAPIIPESIVLGIDTDYKNITVTDESTQRASMLMGSSRVLEGYVYTESGAPLRNAIVALKPERFYRYLFTFTDEEGYYRFDNYVGPGRHEISVIYRGFVYPPQTIYIFVSDRVYNITIPDLYLVSGYYSDLDGNPLSNSYLVFIGGDYLSIAYTDEDGFYRVAIPKGVGQYLVMQRWNNVWLRDLTLVEGDVLDGSENLTAEVETIELSGSIYDPANTNLLGTPIIRFTGLVDGLNLNITIDNVLNDGSFRIRLPQRINLLGVYRDIYWSILMVDYYYSGNTILTNQILSSDLNLGNIAVYTPNLVSIMIELNFTDKPDEIPLDTYRFVTWYNNEIFNISIYTNATFQRHIPGLFILSEDFRGLVLEVSTPLNMRSIIEISIPMNMMSGVFVVTVDDNPWSYEILEVNSSYTRLRIVLEGGMGTIRISSTDVIDEFNPLYLIAAIPITILFILLYWRFKRLV